MHETYLLPAQCSTLLEEVHRDFALALRKDLMYHCLSPVKTSVSARFYVLTVLLMKISVLYVTPYRLVNRYSVIIQY
jgi:hypothetical protein